MERGDIVRRKYGCPEKMMNWAIDDLQFKANVFKETGCITVYGGDVVKSDIAVSETVKEALETAAARLEDVPEDQKDWHPDSGFR